MLIVFTTLPVASLISSWSDGITILPAAFSASGVPFIAILFGLIVTPVHTNPSSTVPLGSISTEMLRILSIVAEIVTLSILKFSFEVVDADNLNVEVTAVEQIVSESYSIPVENIAIQNLKEGYEAVFAESTVTITLKGLRNDLDKLMADSIKGNVNAAGLAEGNHTVTVTLELDDSLYSVNGTQSAVITIKKKTEDTSDTTNTRNDNGTHTGSNGGTETGTGSTNGNNTNNGNSEED